MKRRSPKSEDQDNANKACDLIIELSKVNPQFDANIWVSSCLTCIVRCYHATGFTYDEFYQEIERAIKSYKKYWEEENR